MGIGRSALVSAAVLVSQGLSVETAFEAVGRARGVQVPDTDEQKTYVADISQKLRRLGQHGI